MLISQYQHTKMFEQIVNLVEKVLNISMLLLSHRIASMCVDSETLSMIHVTKQM